MCIQNQLSVIKILGKVQVNVSMQGNWLFATQDQLSFTCPIEAVNYTLSSHPVCLTRICRVVPQVTDGVSNVGVGCHGCTHQGSNHRQVWDFLHFPFCLLRSW